MNGDDKQEENKQPHDKEWYGGHNPMVNDEADKTYADVHGKGYK